MPDIETGVSFPATPDGRRGSTPTGKRILAESVRALDPQLASDIESEPDWRGNYPRLLGRLTSAEARSAEAALHIARTGLAEAHRRFVFVDAGRDLPLSAAVDPTQPAPELRTVHIKPQPARATSRPTLRVPYRGEWLAGDRLLRQLDDWVQRGITEPSFREAVTAVARNPDWLDLSDQTFALLGAGAAMGPYTLLMRWGARVAAVDVPRPPVWERLIAAAKQSPGHLLVPVRTQAPNPDESSVAAHAGADLLTETSSVLQWVEGIEGPLTIGNYGYIPGAAFVPLTMAFDVLFAALIRRRDDVGICYLATPSDAFSIPLEAARMAVRRHRSLTPLNLAYRSIHRATRGKWFQANFEAIPADGSYGLVNALIVEQGPNYAVSKRLQRWRMMTSRTDGIRTSVHVAPPTQTQSVLQNPTMGQRQRLNAKIGLEAFEPGASQALGAAILVHDLRNPNSPANPQTPLHHPHEAFMFAANPGGRWRGPYDPSSSVPALVRLEELRARMLGALRPPRRGDEHYASPQ